MARDRLQNIALIVLVAVLLVTVARIYLTYRQKIPLNLEGNIAVEGSTTANPPALN